MSQLSPPRRPAGFWRATSTPPSTTHFESRTWTQPVVSWPLKSGVNGGSGAAVATAVVAAAAVAATGGAALVAGAGLVAHAPLNTRTRIDAGSTVAQSEISGRRRSVLMCGKRRRNTQTGQKRARPLPVRRRDRRPLCRAFS